jgi:hypothetical protein
MMVARWVLGLGGVLLALLPLTAAMAGPRHHPPCQQLKLMDSQWEYKEDSPLLYQRYKDEWLRTHPSTTPHPQEMLAWAFKSHERALGVAVPIARWSPWAPEQQRPWVVQLRTRVRNLCRYDAQINTLLRVAISGCVGSTTGNAVVREPSRATIGCEAQPVLFQDSQKIPLIPATTDVELTWGPVPIISPALTLHRPSTTPLTWWMSFFGVLTAETVYGVPLVTQAKVATLMFEPWWFRTPLWYY